MRNELDYKDQQTTASCYLLYNGKRLYVQNEEVTRFGGQNEIRYSVAVRRRALAQSCHGRNVRVTFQRAA